ncbi:MAG: Ig-like domain-containing protein [Chitinophagales bacterium]|nr:Ig-like domain-containing protein [Chitinophagales bacterium]
MQQSETTPQGTWTVNPTTGQVTFTPAPNYNGTTTNIYQICDGGTPNLCDTAVITITVVPVNDPPDIVQGPVTTNEDVPTTFCPNISDIDVGDVLTVSICGGPSNGTATVNNNCVTYSPFINYNGPDAICLVVCDNGNPVLCDTVNVPITVLPVDDRPIAANDINNTLINTPVSGNVSTNDEDPDNNPLVYNTTLLTNPQNGTVVLLPNGNYTYVPNNGFTGTDAFRYIVCANSPQCDTAWVFINVVTVGNGNDKPVANNDVAQTFTNTPVSGQVLNNDFDPDGNPLTVNTTPVVPPANGTVVINPNGTFTYTPNPGFTGTDVFSYVVCDQNGACDTAQVVIDVLTDPNGPANDPPFAQDDAYSTPLNTAVSGNVSSNDSDPNGNALTFTLLTNPTKGSATLNSNGTFTYTPNVGYTGPDQFLYRVCDSQGACDTATVYITVLPAPPIAQPDINNTLPNKPVSGNVLTNDEDPNGFPLTVNPTPASGPSNGTVTINPNGTYTYTPNTGFSGTDVFQYTVCNGFYCVTVPVVINVGSDIPGVNQPPVANNDVSQTLVNTPVSGQVLNNDIDPDGNPLTVNTTPVSAPANGTVTINPNGTYTYTPNPGFTGTDNFQYVVCDIQGACDTATVKIDVMPNANGPANDAPFAQDDAFQTQVNTPITKNVSPNDSDPNGNPLTYNTTPVSGPSNGTVTINPNGTFTYQPNAGYAGPDQFTYSVCDNAGLCDTATVYITIIAAPPAAVFDINSTTPQTPVSGNVLTNDEDPNGLPLTVSPIPANPPANGTVTIQPNGNYTYTPNPGFTGTDVFTYVVCNGIYCDTVPVTITVTPGNPSANDAPVANNDQSTTLMNTAVSGQALNNDFDIDGDLLSTIKITNPVNGSVVMNPNGTYTYTPNAGFFGEDSFMYVACDPNGACDTAKVYITVLPNANGPANDAPFAQDDMFHTPEDTPVSGSLAPNDSDPNANPLTYNTTPLVPPTKGTVTINPNGTFTYTPNTNYNGPDQFVYVVCDNQGACDTATAYILVTPVNDAPVANNDVNTTPEETPVNGTVTPNDSDVDGPAVNVTVVSGPTHGTIVMNPNGTYTYTPGTNYNGPDTIVYSYCDGGNPNLCDTAILVITVTPVNDPPVITQDPVATLEDLTVNFCPTLSDPDAGDVLTVSICGGPNNGTASVNNNCVTYTPAQNYNGPDTICLIVCDNGNPVLCDTVLVPITVTPANDPPVANNDLINTPEDTPVTISVLANDTDPEGNISNPPTILDPPSNGTVTVNPNGTITYTPNPNYNGTDTFVYVVCDDDGLCDTATVIVTVTPVNDKPVANNDNATTPENTPVNINVLNNDTDIDGPLTGQPSVIVPPANGTTTVNPNGTITYTPNNNFVGNDTFYYVICDNGTPPLCDTAMVVITVTPVPTPPVINVTPIVTPEDQPFTACYPFSTYHNVDSISVSISCNPSNGTIDTVYVQNGNICVVYVPNANYHGPDSFCITLCDLNTGLCVTQTVPVTVTPASDDCYWLKGISPNGDGQNDAFFINCNEEFPNATLQVFNRWGDLVWKSDGHYTNNFEGKNLEGTILPDGTYYYIYSYNDGSGKQKAGFVQVTR